MSVVELKELVNQQGVIFAVFFVSMVGGLVPVLSVELLLILIAPFLDPHKILIVVTIAAIGQILPKILLFYSGMGATALVKESWKKRISTVKERINSYRYGSDAFIFVSSFTGFPPFYFVSVAAGAMRYRLMNFMIFGGAGRFLRFLLILLFPQLLKDILFD